MTQPNLPYPPEGQQPSGGAYQPPGGGYPPPGGGYPSSGADYPSSGAGYPPPGGGYPPPGGGYPPPGGGYPPPGGGYPPPPGGAYPQQPPKKRTGLILGLVIGGILLLLCCGGGAFAVVAINNNDDPAPTSSTAAPFPTRSAVPPPGNPTDNPTANPGTDPTQGSDRPSRFGADAGFTYGDGVRVQIVSARRYTPSDTAAGDRPGETGVKMQIRVTNGSSQVADLRLVRVEMKAGVNGNEASRVFDVAQDIEGGLRGSLAIGQSATAYYAFSVAEGDLGTLNVEVRPGLTYGPAIFQGSAS